MKLYQLPKLFTLELYGCLRYLGLKSFDWKKSCPVWRNCSTLRNRKSYRRQCKCGAFA